MLDDLLNEWKLRMRVLNRLQDPVIDGMSYQLQKCIYDLESETINKEEENE